MVFIPMITNNEDEAETIVCSY